MPDETIQKILVTGASGNLGSAVVRSLSVEGFSVRGGCRHPGNIPQVSGVEKVMLDYENPGTVKAALRGMEGMLLVAPPLDVAAPDKLNPAIDMAKASGIRHIVLNSAMGMDKSEKAPLRIVERYLMASGVNYTILRPNFFMQNFSSGFLAPMIAHGGIFLPSGDGKTSFISVVDVAAVVTVVFREGHFGKEFVLTGPQAIDHTEAARLISEATGKDIAYHDIPEEQMMQGAREQGMAEDAIQYMVLLYRAVRQGMSAGITGTVTRLAGKPPVTFKEFAYKNAAAWA